MYTQQASINCTIKHRSAPSVMKRIYSWPAQLVGRWNVRIRNYIKRREDRAAFRQIMNLDEHMLKDIGVTREDVIWANNLPISRNASCELLAISKARHRKT